MKSWKDEQIKDLFFQVENFKQQNLSLKEAFAYYAKLYHRKPNSVRNYYYFELKNLKNDEKKRKKLNIDLKKHEISNFALFDETQETQISEEIEKLTAQGMSVRSACLKLSQGDLTLMTRLQNKYQNLKKKSNLNNVIQFEKRQKLLTEQDINSLFFGLVKLIKKTAVEDFMEKKQESESNMLKQAYKDLREKKEELELLQQKFDALKKENDVLKNSKQEALKRHLSANKAKQIKKENV